MTRELFINESLTSLLIKMSYISVVIKRGSLHNQHNLRLDKIFKVSIFFLKLLDLNFFNGNGGKKGLFDFTNFTELTDLLRVLDFNRWRNYEGGW